jgi:hypothetical protein
MNKTLESVTKWMALSVGVFIGSGFFATYTFMSRFHLRDHGAEFLRWKYVYVGTLCWLFPIGLLLPMWGLFFLQKTLEERAAEERLRRYRPGSVVRFGVKQVLASFFTRPGAEMRDEAAAKGTQEFKEDVDALSVMLVTVVPSFIYLTVEFARPGINLPLSCFAATFITFLVLSALDILAVSYSIRRKARLACALAVLLTLSIWGLHLLLFTLHILTSGGAIYVLLTLSSAVILVRTWHFGNEDQVEGEGFAMVTGIALSTLLMIVGVLSFGAFVYPYIPATRGGGDYTVQSDTLIQLKEGTAVCPATGVKFMEKCRDAFGAMRFKVIDSTEGSFFLADTATGGGPCAWREFPTTLAEESNVPVVYEINKKEIAAMISEMPLQHDCSEYSEFAWQRILVRTEALRENIHGFWSTSVAQAKLFCRHNIPLCLSYL